MSKIHFALHSLLKVQLFLGTSAPEVIKKSVETLKFKKKIGKRLIKSKKTKVK